MLYALAELEAQGNDSATLARREQRLAQVLAVAPANLAARLDLLDVQVRRNEADSAVRQLEEIRRIPPEPPAEARVYLDSAIQLLRAQRVAEARGPLDRFAHVLATTKPYQASRDEVKWTEGPVPGRPVLTFNPTYLVGLRGVRTRATIDSVKFVDVTDNSGLLDAERRDNPGSAAMTPPAAGSTGHWLSATSTATERTICSFLSGRRQQRARYSAPVQNAWRIRARRHRRVGDLASQRRRLRHLRRLTTTTAGSICSRSAATARPSLPESRQRHVRGRDVEGRRRRRARGAQRRLRRSRSRRRSRSAARRERPAHGLSQQSRRHLHRRDRERSAWREAATRATSLFADFDGDGRIDVFIANANGSDALLAQWRRAALQRRDRRERPNELGVGPARSPSATTTTTASSISSSPRANGGDAALWLNNGNGTFRRDTRSAPTLGALMTARLATAATFVDYDNDGWLDLLVVGTPAGGKAGLASFSSATMAAGSFVDRSSLIPAAVQRSRRLGDRRHRRRRRWR